MEAGVAPKCVECGAEADELATGWRAYPAGDLDEDDATGDPDVLPALH